MRISSEWFRVGLLPEQYFLIKGEKRNSFLIGATIGNLGMGILLCILFFGFVIPGQINFHKQEILIKNERIQKQRDEIGILTGVIHNAFGKNAPLLIDQFRLKFASQGKENPKGISEYRKSGYR